MASQTGPVLSYRAPGRAEPVPFPDRSLTGESWDGRGERGEEKVLWLAEIRVPQDKLQPTFLLRADLGPVMKK